MNKDTAVFKARSCRDYRTNDIDKKRKIVINFDNKK